MIWLLALQLGLTPQQASDSAARDLRLLNFTRADEEVDAALRQDPYLVSALILKANLALFANQPEIARRCLVAAVVGHPSSAVAQLGLGIFYYSQGSFALALPPLSIAHGLSPLDPKPSLYLAMSYEALYTPLEAMRFYREAERQALHLPAQAAPVLTAYGRFLSATGRYREAIEKERLAVKANTHSREAHYELAKALDLNRSYTEAAAEAELALTLPPSGIADTQIHLLLHELYLKLNQADQARSHAAKLPAAGQAAIP